MNAEKEVKKVSSRVYLQKVKYFNGKLDIFKNKTNHLQHDLFLFQAFGNLSRCQEYCVGNYKSSRVQ